VVTAAELISLAAFEDGKWSQAFPSFGSERTGAPVTAFCRIHDRAIRTREPVLHPDVVIIQDSTLLHHVDVFSGLSPDGYILINSTRNLEELGVAELCATFPTNHVHTLPASDFSMKYLGRPMANVALVAGLAAMTQWLTQASVEKVIQQKFPGRVGVLNTLAATEAYGYVAGLLALT
jgi:pyruvate ferredoxin oxidoreductase gamma subunit